MVAEGWPSIVPMAHLNFEGASQELALHFKDAFKDCGRARRHALFEVGEVMELIMSGRACLGCVRR